jgi:hypothetical protein
VTDQSDSMNAAPVHADDSAASGAPVPVAQTPIPVAPGGSSPVAGAAERPEVVVGAAFAGGIVLALILKRLAR